MNDKDIGNGELYQVVSHYGVFLSLTVHLQHLEKVANRAPDNKSYKAAAIQTRRRLKQALKQAEEICEKFK